MKRTSRALERLGPMSRGVMALALPRLLDRYGISAGRRRRRSIWRLLGGLIVARVALRAFERARHPEQASQAPIEPRRSAVEGEYLQPGLG